MSGTSPLAGRLALKVGTGAAAQTFDRILSAAIARDLRDVAATFELEVYDGARALAAMAQASQDGAPGAPITQGAACTLSIDGEAVLTGWVDIAEGEWTGETITARLRGRDKTGDLVDCAAAPGGPAEFRKADLLHIARAICAPFGITVRAQTEIGAPFERLAIGPHETAMVVLEKAARQRSVLIVSDGVGGLLLTTGGRANAPGPLLIGDAVQAASYRFDWTRRYSDVWVKGQTERANGARQGVPAALDHNVAPLAAGTAPALPPTAQSTEAGAILMSGHAVDPAMTRWRPVVKTTRTQSGMDSVQTQAEWWVRVLRGESTLLSYTVVDWRGPSGALWRPNEKVRVRDPYAGIDDEMLIRKVTYRLRDGDDGGGAVTEIEVVGLTAFDRINQAQPRRPLRAKYAPYPSQYTEFPTRPQ